MVKPECAVDFAKPSRYALTSRMQSILTLTQIIIIIIIICIKLILVL